MAADADAGSLIGSSACGAARLPVDAHERIRVRARPTAEKRRKEVARQARKLQKAERRGQRRVERENRTTADDGTDPTIAHIVPGPQPREDEES